MKVCMITEPTATGGIYKYTTDLIAALGDRVETRIAMDALPSDDIVHCQHAWGYMSPEFILNLKARPELNLKPFIVTLHEIPLWPHENWYKRAGVDFIIGNIMMERELLRLEVSQEKIHVIPHGAKIWNSIPKQEARRKLELNTPYKNIIVQPGFISWGKGISEVIYAVSRIPDTYLVFAGGVHPNATKQDKNYLLQCMKGAKSIGMEDRVHFCGGFLSEEELNLWMSASDILILNHQFVYGSYSASAMAKRILCAERPIIMSTDVRLSEYVDGKHCLKVVPEDVKQVETAINRILNNEELQNHLIKNAREYAEIYSWKHMADRHIVLYNNVIEG